MRPLFALWIIAALAACTPRPPADNGAPDMAMPVSDTCGAAAYEAYLGGPASAVEALALPASARVLRPADARTEDYSPSRLNFLIDDDDILTGITCE